MEQSVCQLEKNRTELGEKVNTVKTQLHNVWPDAYLMLKDMYVFHLSTTKHDLEVLLRAIDEEIERVKS